MEFQDLIENARKLFFERNNLSPQVSAGVVVCGLLTKKGNAYYGINIDTHCGLGFCAEHSAVSQMIMAGESEIEKIVALTRERILPPCGRCRELLYQVNHSNLKTEVLVEEGQILTLEQLLPYRWWRPDVEAPPQ